MTKKKVTTKTKTIKKEVKAKAKTTTKVRTQKTAKASKRVAKTPERKPMVSSKPLDKKIQYIMSPSKVQARRMELSLSQIEVSRELGITRIHYGNIEKGLTQVREVVADKISAALGLQISDLFKSLGNGKFKADK